MAHRWTGNPLPDTRTLLQNSRHVCEVNDNDNNIEAKDSGDDDIDDETCQRYTETAEA